MPLTVPSANKKQRVIKWDAEPALPRASAGWEKVVAIGFATALGAGAVALATILMVVSPAESEWQPRPLGANMAAANDAAPPMAQTAASGQEAAEFQDIAAAQNTPNAPAPAAASAQARADVPVDAVLAARARAADSGESVAIAVQSTPITEPNEQRWARSVSEGVASRRVAAASDIADEASPEPLARDGADKQRVAAIPLSALVAEPVRPADLAPELAEPEAAEPAAQRKLRLSSSANLRARPANGAKVLGTIAGGTSVASFGCNRGWCEVSVNGKRGFIASRFLGEKAKVRRASAPAKKKRAAKSKRRSTQRRAAAAPVERKEKAALPGVFANVPATPNGGR